MTKPPPWNEVQPRFRRMVLALGFCKVAARTRGRVGKSILYVWFKGMGRRPGRPAVVPSPEKVAVVWRVLLAWEAESAVVRNVKPAPVWRGWPSRWKNQPEGGGDVRAVAYR